MNAVDEALRDHFGTLTVEQRLLACSGLYEAERSVLQVIAPPSFSSDDLMAFVYYHLHGEELPEEFFVQRRTWLESHPGDTKS
jgi:hypothetical protein